MRPVRLPQPDLKSRRIELLQAAKLYVCTDARSDLGDLAEFLDAAYQGGVDIIQLRDKKLEARDEMKALEILAEVARRHGKLFAVNDRADVAALVDADIFHVGQGELSPDMARAILGDDVLIGRSNHTEAMFNTSLAHPELDYAVIGPIWRTPTKPGREPVGLTTVSAAAQLASMAAPDKPWFAIGGINADNLADVIDHGAQRIVVVRAITDASTSEDAWSRAQAVKRQLN